jgi:hypothetical protein
MSLSRTPFKKKFPTAYARAERVAPNIARLTVKVNMPRADDGADSIPKASPVRSEAYRRLVAALPCAHCAIAGHSQAAHADMGKGAHIKSDDRTCYPACAPRPGAIGCHSLIGSTGTYSRDARRTLEAEYAASTRKTIRASGLWPKKLPHLEIQQTLGLIG